MKKLKYAVLISFLLIGVAAFSQKIVDFQISSCERNSYPEFIHHNRLIHKELKNDTLLLQVGIVRNCNFSPRIAQGYIGDTLVLDISNKSDHYAACDCCYELNLQIVGIPDTNFTLGEKFLAGDFIDGEFKEWTTFVEYIYYQNKFIFPTLEEVDTISKYDQLNSDSLKIGWWYRYSKINPENYSKLFYFIDQFGESRVKWQIRYNENNEITEVSALTGIDWQGISNMQIIDGEFYLSLMSSK